MAAHVNESEWVSSFFTSKCGAFLHSNALTLSPIRVCCHTNVVYSVWEQSSKCVSVPRCVVAYDNTVSFICTNWPVVYLKRRTK